MSLRVLIWSAVAVVLGLAPAASEGQQAGTMSDAEYIAKIKTAAPAAVVDTATIIQVGKSGKRVLQMGANGFTCAVSGEIALCADRNALAWMRAIGTHGVPPASVGFAYMLAGDMGDSNTDPYATAPTATNHWVKTGPHVMIFAPDVKAMGYPTTLDADPTRPYVMWQDTPYAHLMIPVA
jgi:hypothetical protein